MKITPIPHGLDLLASDLVRSPGLHMSDIYNDLYAALEPRRYTHTGPPNPVLLALGTAWERHLEFLLRRAGVRVTRPGELFVPDLNIAYSPDGILEDEDRYRLVEYKLSSMSTKDLPRRPASSFPPKFNKCTCQQMDYCHGIESNLSRLYFTSIYRPHDPELLVWNIEFTPRELRDNWAANMSHARMRKMI